MHSRKKTVAIPPGIIYNYYCIDDVACTVTEKREGTSDRRHSHCAWVSCTHRTCIPPAILLKYNMSETQRYNMVEEYKLDTWAFLTVMAVLATVAHI